MKDQILNSPTMAGAEYAVSTAEERVLETSKQFARQRSLGRDSSSSRSFFYKASSGPRIALNPRRDRRAVSSFYDPSLHNK